MFLVDNHLTFWRTATTRNLDDPEVIAEFAAIVKNRSQSRRAAALHLRRFQRHRPGCLERLEGKPDAPTPHRHPQLPRERPRKILPETRCRPPRPARRGHRPDARGLPPGHRAPLRAHAGRAFHFRQAGTHRHPGAHRPPFPPARGGNQGPLRLVHQVDRPHRTGLHRTRARHPRQAAAAGKNLLRARLRANQHSLRRPLHPHRRHRA